jgi:polyisoprenoid-binding protein YceI
MQSGTQKGLASVRYVIDPSVSRFTVQAFATGLLSTFGHNPTIAISDWHGEIQFVPESYEKAFVRLTVRTGAMQVLDEIKEKDRKTLEQTMYGEVLEVDRYPEAVFEGKQISVQRLGTDLWLARATGDLSFHGVTQTHSFEARVTPMAAMMRISGEFSLRQSDYRIKPVSFAAGTLRLKDELKFNFELVARSQEEGGS